MPIDESLVKWDDTPAKGRIDESAVQWDDEPKPKGMTTKRAVNKFGTAAIPIIGPTLAAFGVEIDPAEFAKGIPSGFADVGNTIMNRGTKTGADLITSLPESPLTAGLPGRRPDMRLSDLITGTKPQADTEQFNAEREAGLKQFNTENASPSFSGGRLIGNVAATAPAGGAIGTVMRGVLPRLAPLADAISTGGFRTGMAPTTRTGQLLNVGTRMAGGGVQGGVSAGLVDPDTAGSGALWGAVLPPGFQAAGQVGNWAARGLRSTFAPQRAKDAASILEAGALNADDLPAVRAALRQEGPHIVQQPGGGGVATVPQILQNPGISQLGRTLRNSGDTSLLAAEQAQEVARQDTLRRVSPTTGTVQQARENFGNTLGPQVRAADEAARARTQAAFDAVDPFDETRFLLPIPEMRAAQNKFLGPGTFNGGGNAQRAIDTARGIGEETIEAVKPSAVPGVRRQGQDIVQAIKSLGGIKQDSRGAQLLAGEIRDLKQTGNLRSIIQNGRGQSPDTLAEAMHAQGFLPDADPATLMNVLREHAAGNKVYAIGADRSNTFRAGLEGAMGDAPGAATVPKPVSFREVQNLRSSIGEAHADAQAKGRTREAAALDQMRRDIDAKVDDVAAGNGRDGEFFPADVVDTWRDALALHKDRMERFRTGPQASIFRQGGDGQPAAQGAELAPKFFSPRLSQADDMAAFQRVATPETTGLLKNYAVTDAGNQTDRLGRLTNSKFNDWLQARSGAINGLFNEGERAGLSAVGRDLARADAAENLGRATGSNTAQNVQSALGLGFLDRPWVNVAASRTPLIGKFTGPMLDALRQSAKRGKVDRLGALMSDPQALEQALAAYQRVSAGRPFGLAGGSSLSPLIYRAAPLLATSQ
ncbi:hypothetical protein J7E62_09180 [Variovorax paradoxus]|nr:hypothetical protein [Variovorax paradoxus]